MPTVLSTKRLTPVQKKHLLVNGIGLVDYNAVQIKDLELKLESDHFENAIFTSQNAVKIAKAKHLNVKHAFCVGKKTAKAASEIAEKVMAVAENGKALAQVLVDNYENRTFHFFCSKQRRNELPEVLKKHGIGLTEHHLYESVPKPKVFKNQFDAVLCFSPLGIKAYYENNTFRPPAICIGTTTAQAAKNYAETYISTKTSVESVVVKTIKVLNTNT